MTVTVWVGAAGPIRERLEAALAADGLPVASNGSAPDVALLTVDVGGPDGLDELEAAVADAPAVPVVVVAPGFGRLGVRRALRAGVSSLVLEAEIGHALAPAVRAAAAGLSAVPLVLRIEDRPTFSHREQQALRLAIGGRTNSEIATALFLAESTVKSHLSSAFRKLGATCRKEAASLVLDPAEGLTEVVLGVGNNNAHVANGHHAGSLTER